MAIAGYLLGAFGLLIVSNIFAFAGADGSDAEGGKRIICGLLLGILALFLAFAAGQSA